MHRRPSVEKLRLLGINCGYWDNQSNSMKALRRASSTRDKEERVELRGRGGGVDMKEMKRICPNVGDSKWLDQFPYYPTYRFNAYRTYVGAVCTLLMAFIFFLRVVSSLIDFMEQPPIVTMARTQFPRDSEVQYLLPTVGVQFRQNGWQPFNDPRYISIKFEQGNSLGRESRHTRVGRGCTAQGLIV